MSTPKKNKKWYQYLLAIPVTLVIDILVLVATIFIDEEIMGNPSGAGHPMPALSLVVFYILCIVTILISVRQVVLAIRTIFRRNITEEQKEIIEKGKAKHPLMTFIPLTVLAIISMAIVILYGKNEIDSFYSDPSHIGFAVPIGTFAIAGILFLFLLVVFIISLIAYRKRKRAR